MSSPVLRTWIRMFLGFLDPDPSIIKQKNYGKPWLLLFNDFLEVTDEKSRIRIRKSSVRVQESEPDGSGTLVFAQNTVAYLWVLNVACFKTCILATNNRLYRKYFLLYLICLEML
jgi:hypothetical protein